MISSEVKIRYAAACCIFAVFSSVMCGCKPVSEGYVMGDTHIQETVVLTDEPYKESAETTAVTTENITYPAETSAPEETDSVMETEETAQTVQTIQPESPPETEKVTEQTSVTERVTENVTTAASSVTTETVTTAETTVTTTAETSVVTEPQNIYNYGYNSYSALNFREQKGIWFSFLEYDSIMKNKSASAFRKTIGECFDNVKSLGFNTVYTQVRAYGDAYYSSALFPSGDRFNGTMGTSQSFDALEIMIEEAHSRGLSLHAWINPMRLMTETQLASLDDRFTVKKWYNDKDKNGKYIVYTGGRWYLNPAYSEVTELIANGIAEIAANYDVDGIQIDDYFYPTTAASFDSAAYSASGTDMSLAAWRTENVNKMVKRLCKAAHGANNTVLFGISPQGSVDNNYNELYADVKKWCADSAYCDYILPQVYFGFDNAGLPYLDTIETWSRMASSGNVKLVIGLAGYKIGAVDNYGGAGGKNEWIENSDIISRQMKEAAKLSNYGGVALFRYGSMFTPDKAVAEQVSKEIEGIKKAK